MSNSVRYLLFKFIAIIAIPVVLAGCFSIEKGRLKSSGEEQVLVSNYGWYLFHIIPVACGNASEGAVTPWVLFRNDVTMDKVQKRFFSYADTRENINAEGLSYRTHESVLFEIPGSNIPIPLPYVLSYKEIQLSGVLVPNKDKSK